MRAPAVVAVLAAAAACSDGNGGITAPADRAAQLAVVPGILIGADSNPVTVTRGSSATVNVRVTRVAGFTGPVTLAVDTAGIARGVRATVANATIAAGDTAARAITITVDTSATASTTPTNFRVTASGTGVTTQTLLMQVVVANQAQGFTLAFAGASNASLQTGGTGTVRVIVRRTGGFTGPLTFTADAAGLPAGVTVTQGATSGDTVTLNLAAGATTTPGNYTVTLRGTGTGVTAQTLSLPLSVQQAGNFSIGGTGPITVTGAAGTTVTVPVRIGRGTGFTGRVALAATGAPTGVTAVFDTAVTGGGTTESVADLRLTLPANLAPGTYDITVTGRATGLANQTATVRLTVTPALTGGFGFGTPTQRPVVLAGLTNVINVPIQRATGTAGSGVVTFTSGPTPPGIVVTSTPTSATGTTAVVTITAGADVPAGTYPVTLTGAGPGGTQTTTLNVEVVRDNPSFGFRFVAPSATPTVTAGGSTTFTAGLERIATLAPDALLNVTNVARGITVQLTRINQAEGPIEITVTADATALPGTYQFTLTGATTRGNIPPIVIPVRVTAATTTTPTTP